MSREHFFQSEIWINKPVEEVFPFFSEATNLQRLTPPWLHFEILTPAPIKVERGATIDYRLRWHGIPMRWRTEITRWHPPVEFCDSQLSGPYRVWEHTHRFVAEGAGTRMIDIVRYQLPFGWFGEAAHIVSVRESVKEIFEYRSEQIKAIFEK
jgi:ligand-binding SRPBCC domain-containing protein